KKCSFDDFSKNYDVFVSVTGKKNLVTPSMIKEINQEPIIFSLTNPNQEIKPDTAKKAGAKIVATGSYLYHNKVNNALVFPHLMRVILDSRIKKITTDMMLAAAMAISKTVPDKQLGYEHILPDMFDKNIQKNLSKYLASFKTRL